MIPKAKKPDPMKKEGSWNERPGHQNGDSIGRLHVPSVDLTIIFSALFSTLSFCLSLATWHRSPNPTPTCVLLLSLFNLSGLMMKKDLSTGVSVPEMTLLCRQTEAMFSAISDPKALKTLQ